MNLGMGGRGGAVLALVLLAFCLLALLWPSAEVVGPPVPENAGTLYKPDREPWRGAPPNAGSSKPIAEQAGEPWRGLVTSASTGQPVAGALVYGVLPSARCVRENLPSRSGDDGSFVYFLPEHANYRLIALAEGYRPWTLTIERETKPPETIALEDGEAISGRVVDQGGDAVPDAKVWCTPFAERVVWPVSSDMLPCDVEGRVGARTTTDEHGGFLLTGLERGLFEVRASKHMMAIAPWSSPPQVLSGQRDVLLVLTQVTTLAVRAVDSATGRPIQVARLSLSCGRLLGRTSDLVTGEADLGVGTAEGPGGPGDYSVMSFARTKFAEMETAEAKVHAEAPGYRPTEQPVELRFGKELSIDVPLEPSFANVGESMREVSFTATFPMGASYTGSLLISIRDSGDPLGAGVVALEFRDGHAVEPLSLPPGDYEVYPLGGNSPSTRFWQRAGQKASLHVGREQRPWDCHLALEGSPVALATLDGSGRPVYGYDLLVNTVFGGGLSERWGVSVLRASASVDDLPVIWLPKGPVVVGVSLPGAGRCTRSVEIAGDGERVRLDLVLQAEGEQGGEPKEGTGASDSEGNSPRSPDLVEDPRPGEND